MKLVMPSNKNFGLTFGIIFGLAFLVCIFNNLYIYNLLILSIIFLILGLINSKILFPLNWIWFKFGIILSKTISPIILFLLYFVIVSPYGFLVKLFNKDLNNIKKRQINSKTKSYWNISNEKENIKFDKQY